jgi:hypothetical protein
MTLLNFVDSLPTGSSNDREPSHSRRQAMGIFLHELIFTLNVYALLFGKRVEYLTSVRN